MLIEAYELLLIGKYNGRYPLVNERVGAERFDETKVKLEFAKAPVAPVTVRIAPAVAVAP